MIFNIENGLVTLKPDNAEDEEILTRLQDTNQYRGRSRIKDSICLDDLTITPSSNKDAVVLDTLACALFRTGSLLRVEGNTFTAALCKGCSIPIISYWECEIQVCDACSEMCNHDYMRGVAYNSKREIFITEICKKCNRCMPGESDKTPEQIAKELFDEFGVMVV